MKTKVKTTLLLLACLSTQAQALPAFLTKCEMGHSVTGRFIHIGTYNYQGQYFQRVFTSWCPQVIDVY